MRFTPKPHPNVPERRAVAAGYLVFALVSTALNLAAQQMAVALLANRTAAATPVSVVFGTLVGFACKYLLDKHFIFMDRSRSSTEELRKVALYGLFGIGTTALFWCCELGAFYAIGGTPAKFTGAVVGLGLGYVAKFALDRRYTFASSGERAPTLALRPI